LSDLCQNEIKVEIELFKAIMCDGQADTIPIGAMKLSLRWNQLQQFYRNFLCFENVSEQFLVLR
jgi:hypothetical protein